jgi:hypothetical protein
MDEDNTPELASRLEAHAHDGKSKLYQYLWRQHRVLSKAIAKLNPTWASIAAEITAAGVMGNNGKPASPKAVRNIWWRVCRDVEAAKQVRRAERDGKGRQPSRLPVTWRPPVAQHARPVVQPRYPPPATPAPASTPPATPPELNDKARAMLDSLDRQLAHRDRFINPPKRKE